jgi:hypothetical protein
MTFHWVFVPAKNSLVEKKWLLRLLTDCSRSKSVLR